jgi:crotonobetainyl-CoA:carnitine CoA-transferase CaiB-like acyl-CoA transferase
MSEQTLAGMKVVDLTWYIAGPYCTKLLADYGAEVLKIERPPDGDPARRIGPFLDDDSHPEKSLLFSHLNLNKKGLTLDLKTNEGKTTAEALVRDADILVENFSPGVMRRLGLDYENLKQINPDLVMTSISNFGQTGPYRDFKASELIFAGIGHDMYSTGVPGRYPLKLGGSCLQYQAGHMAAAATLAAYWLQQTKGVGQHIDVSIQEVLSTDTDHKTTNLVSFAYSGMSMTLGVVGRQDPREISSDITPSGVYPCKDGFVRVAGGLAFWSRFVRLFPELEDQFTYPDDVLNLENKGIVDALWYEWCATRTKNEIMEACQAVKYFAVAINTPKDAVEDPQFKERGYWVEVEHPLTGKRIYPGDPLHAEASPWKATRPAPLLGQHNDEILADLSPNPSFNPDPGADRVKVRHREEKTVVQGLPLEGIRVVDMGVIWAGPTAAWLMSILGAEVIHVDNPHHFPDFGRGFTNWRTQAQLNLPAGRSLFPQGKPETRPWNRNAFYNRVLWNRLCCSIDLDKPEGKEVFKRLIKASDVFIENNSATAMEHLGLGHDVLLETHPGLICINMPAWGRSGPYKDYVGWGAMHQAIGGEEWIRGYDDDEHPSHNSYRFHMDSAGAPMAVFGAIMGLIQRGKSGAGQWIDFAQMQALIAHFGEIYMDAAWNGKNHRTLGNRHPTALQGCYRCRGPESTLDTVIYGGERWINITIANDEEWKRFCDVLGNPEWTRDDRFATVRGRREHHDELDVRIEKWTRTRDNFEAFYVLQEHGVPAGPVVDYRDAHMDPQLNSRGFFQTITGPDIGTYRYPGFPWKLSETPLRVARPPCRLGEDNDYVYRDVIKLTDEEIFDLEGKKIIGGLSYDWAGPAPEDVTGEMNPDVLVL